MKERRKLIRWIKEHKKELILAGISIGTLGLIVLGIKNRATIKAVWNSLKKVVKQPTVKITNVTVFTVDNSREPIQVMTSSLDSIPIEVRRHIRILPKGWHASPEKIAEAKRNNIKLLEGQTWVRHYCKRGSAA